MPLAPKDALNKFKLKLKRPVERQQSTRETPKTPPATRNQFQKNRWKWSIESLVSLLGYNVNLTSVTLLPYYCIKYGGIAFLSAYILVTILCCFPLYYIQLAMGQFSGFSAISIWHAIPLFRGIGYAALVLTFLLTIYYASTMVWTLHYLTVSIMERNLTWFDCGDFSTSACSIVPPDLEQNCTDVCYNSTYQYGLTDQWKMPAEEFFQLSVLRLSAGIEFGGKIQPQLFVWLLAVWLMACFCLWRSAQSASKVSFASLVVCDCLFLALLVRVLMSEGGADGLKAYFSLPTVDNLKDINLWGQAGLLAFYSMFPNWGSVLTIGGFHRFQFKFNINAALATVASAVGSICLGMIPAGLMGILAKEMHMHVGHLNAKGPNLLFVACAQALRSLPTPRVWACLFYLLVLLVSLNTFYWMINTLVVSSIDALPRKLRRWYVRIGGMAKVFTLGVLFGLATVCQAGLYVTLLFDRYIGRYTILLLAFLEVVAVAYIYGVDRLLEDVYFMTNSKCVKNLWHPILKAVTPLILLLLLIYSICAAIMDSSMPIYGDYSLPNWARIVGCVLNVGPLILLSIFMLPALATAPGENFTEVLKGTLRPNSKWGPANAQQQAENVPKIEVQPEKERKIVESTDPLKAKRPAKISGTEKAMKPGKINRATQVTRDVEIQTSPGPETSENEEDKLQDIEERDDLEEAEVEEDRGPSEEPPNSDRKKKHRHKKRHKHRERSSSSASRDKDNKESGSDRLPPIPDRRSRRRTDSNSEPTPIDEPDSGIKLPPLQQPQTSSGKRRDHGQGSSKLPKIDERSMSSESDSRKERQRRKMKRQQSEEFY